MKRQAVFTEQPARVPSRAPSILPFPVTFRFNLTALLIVYALLLALGLGLGSAYLALKGDPPFGGVRLGPWQGWPRLGSQEADPYMRAITAYRSSIPLAVGEGLALTASVDSDGRPLDSACTYRVGSATPPARLWTLSVYDRDGRLAVSELGRSGFTSSEILWNADDTFTIVLSRGLSAGNWLQLPQSGRFSLALRLYDTPGVVGSYLDPTVFPSIQRVECRS